MTPEQAAAFINAQAALFLGELALLKAKGVLTAIDDLKDGGNRNRAAHVIALRALLDRYDCVLGHNAVLQLFQDTAR